MMPFTLFGNTGLTRSQALSSGWSRRWMKLSGNKIECFLTAGFGYELP
jgi:hypothetical protein